MDEIPTPAALVDLDRFEANVAYGVERARMLGVALRPHAKTVKSPELLKIVVAGGVVGLTASTLGEVRTLRTVTDDILYAVPVAAGKAASVLDAVGDADLRLTVLVDSVAGLKGVPVDSRIAVAIEIDSDGRRGGVAADDPTLAEVADRVAYRHRLRGVVTHAGGSYLATPPAVVDVARRERDLVREAAATLRGVGHDVEMVSVGSTPTFAAVDHLAGVTEARPGVYLFSDLSMAALGVRPAESMALSVLATVIGLRGRQAIIDAGWSALSQDRGVPLLEGSALGRIDDRLSVVSATQEHGLVEAVDGSVPGLAVGDRVRVWPNHACATAEMHGSYVTVRGDRVVGTVSRPRGW